MGAGASGQTKALALHWADACDCLPALRSRECGTQRVCAEDTHPMAAPTPGRCELPSGAVCPGFLLLGVVRGRGWAARRTGSAEGSMGQCQKGTSSNPSLSKDAGSRGMEKRERGEPGPTTSQCLKKKT